MNSKHTTKRFLLNNASRWANTTICLLLSITLGLYIALPVAALADDEPKASAQAVESDEASESDKSVDATPAEEEQEEGDDSAADAEEPSEAAQGESESADDEGESADAEAEDDATDEEEEPGAEETEEGEDDTEFDSVDTEDDSDLGESADSKAKRKASAASEESEEAAEAEEDEEEDEEEARRKEEEEEKKKKEEEEKERDEKAEEEIEKAREDLDRAGEAAAELSYLMEELDYAQENFEYEGKEYSRLNKMATQDERALHESEKRMDAVYALNGYACRNVQFGEEGIRSAHVIEKTALANEANASVAEDDGDEAFEAVESAGADEASSDESKSEYVLEAAGVVHDVQDDEQGSSTEEPDEDPLAYVDSLTPVEPSRIVGGAALAMAGNMETATAKAQADVLERGSRYAQSKTWAKRQGELARTAREEANDIAYAIDTRCSEVRRYDRAAMERLEEVDEEAKGIEDALKEARETIEDHDDAREVAQDRAGEWYDLLDSIGGVEATASFGVGYDFALDEDEFVEKWGGAIDRYLKGYGASIGTRSPLCGFGKEMARQAYKYKVDPRLCAAVSILESSGGTVCIKQCNAWGWGAADSDPYGLAYSWSTWGEAIEAWTRGVAESDAGMGEAPSVSALGDIYASSPTWASRVVAFMQGITDHL